MVDQILTLFLGTLKYAANISFSRQSDYRLTFGGKGKFLKSDAVPSLFKCTSQAAPGRKQPMERPDSDTESDDKDVEEGACASPQCVHHASFDHAVQPKRIEDKLKAALARIAELEGQLLACPFEVKGFVFNSRP